VIAAAFVALLWLAGAESAAGDETPDFLYVSGEADHFSPGGGGGAGGVLWTHGFSEKLVSEAGGYAYSLEGTSWAYGKIGATLIPSPRTILHLEANVGGGTQAGAGIEYQAFRGALTQGLVTGRLWADLESQYIRFGDSNGNVLKLGAIVAPVRNLSGRLAYYFSTGGNLGARYVTLRLDLQRRRVGLFAGFSVGHSRPELLNLFAPPTVVDSTEVYFGIRVPAGREEVTAYVDSVGIEGVRRSAVAIVLKLRL
jgi:hypothetical protein